MSAPVDVLAGTAEHREEQAAWAVEYAMKRPASDMRGFFAALRDAAEFKERAALARVQGGAA